MNTSLPWLKPPFAKSHQSSDSSPLSLFLPLWKRADNRAYPKGPFWRLNKHSAWHLVIHISLLLWIIFNKYLLNTYYESDTIGHQGHMVTRADLCNGTCLHEVSLPASRKTTGPWTVQLQRVPWHRSQSQQHPLHMCNTAALQDRHRTNKQHAVTVLINDVKCSAPRGQDGWPDQPEKLRRLLQEVVSELGAKEAAVIILEEARSSHWGKTRQNKTKRTCRLKALGEEARLTEGTSWGRSIG